MALEDLILEGERVLATKERGTLMEYVNNDLYEPWKRKSLMFLQENYPGNPQIKTFEEIVAHNNEPRHCRALLAILKAFNDVKPNLRRTNYEGVLSMLFNRFHIVARQIKRRHDGRATLEIHDEYDVQDLLNAMLLLHFEDVRPEEWTPSYGGGANRIDFLLKDDEIAIEVKMTRDGLKDKELGEQLIIDIAKYQSHPNCKQLYCFIYDPEGIIRNPRGLEKDLEKIGGGFPVRVFVRPL